MLKIYTGISAEIFELVVELVDDVAEPIIVALPSGPVDAHRSVLHLVHLAYQLQLLHFLGMRVVVELNLDFLVLLIELHRISLGVDFKAILFHEQLAILLSFLQELGYPSNYEGWLVIQLKLFLDLCQRQILDFDEGMLVIGCEETFRD